MGRDPTARRLGSVEAHQNGFNLRPAKIDTNAVLLGSFGG